MNKLSKKEIKQLRIFLLITFGMPIFMAIFMWIGFQKGIELSIFPLVQMFFPACGVILALMMTNEKNKKLPKKFFIGFLVLTALLVVMSILSVMLTKYKIGAMGNIVVIIGTVIELIFLLVENKEVRNEYNLLFKSNSKKKAWIYVILFIVLYVLRIIIPCLLKNDLTSLKEAIHNPMFFGILFLPIDFFLAFTPFLGEEYGWRYFLQPLLHKKFGSYKGIILLGIIWGIWHLPINVFYYSPDTTLQSIVSQQVTCISSAIFFGYVYMKTKNIWITVWLHFFNNNLIPFFTGSTDIGNQIIPWNDVLIFLGINLVLFVPFILAKVWRTSGYKYGILSNNASDNNICIDENGVNVIE